MIDDPVFVEACRLADVKPNKRQLSKYRNEHGAAFPNKYKAAAILRNKRKKEERAAGVGE